MFAVATCLHWTATRLTKKKNMQDIDVCQKSTGHLLYVKAKTLIPGGTGLLSKRPEMFLPEQWPAYYSRAQGAHVWDLDGRRYVDMVSAPGCFALGAADPDVNRAVHEAVNAGSFSTLNAPEEVELAELLLELHPWCQGGQVRFARGGGEIDMMAVRIARAHTGRDKVAICGYHGWTDWYLAANLGQVPGTASDNLGKHWLADVTPHGVPQHLSGSSVTWDYGDASSLKRVLESHPGEFAAIVMEPSRDGQAPPNFLEAVRALADEHGVVLIFDEVSSAWRETCGGIHLKFSIAPDMATFSKTMSNGFAMAAVIGRAEPMSAAQRTFISTTYHTERLGPVAALSTIRKFQSHNVQSVNCKRGMRIREGWLSASRNSGLQISLSGLKCWPSFSWRNVQVENGTDATTILTTLFTQEMLSRGFLATNCVCIGLAHTDEIVDEYLRACNAVFLQLALWIQQCNGDVVLCKQFLRGPMKHNKFQPIQ